jgi:hypothetical protein
VVNTFFILCHTITLVILCHTITLFILCHTITFYSLSHNHSFYSLSHNHSFYSLSHNHSFYSVTQSLFYLNPRSKPGKFYDMPFENHNLISQISEVNYGMLISKCATSQKFKDITHTHTQARTHTYTSKQASTQSHT